MTRERTVERRFRELAARHGGMAFKWESPGVAGVPDRILLLPGGRMFLVELKRPGGRPRPIQEAMHARLERLGFPVHVVDDADEFYRTVVDGDRTGERE